MAARYNRAARAYWKKRRVAPFFKTIGRPDTVKSYLDGVHVKLPVTMTWTWRYGGGGTQAHHYRWIFPLNFIDWTGSVGVGGEWKQWPFTNAAEGTFMSFPFTANNTFGATFVLSSPSHSGWTDALRNYKEFTVKGVSVKLSVKNAGSDVSGTEVQRWGILADAGFGISASTAGGGYNLPTGLTNLSGGNSWYALTADGETMTSDQWMNVHQHSYMTLESGSFTNSWQTCRTYIDVAKFYERTKEQNRVDLEHMRSVITRNIAGDIQGITYPSERCVFQIGGEVLSGDDGSIRTVMAPRLVRMKLVYYVTARVRETALNTFSDE